MTVRIFINTNAKKVEKNYGNASSIPGPSDY